MGGKYKPGNGFNIAGAHTGQYAGLSSNPLSVVFHSVSLFFSPTPPRVCLSSPACGVVEERAYRSHRIVNENTAPELNIPPSHAFAPTLPLCPPADSPCPKLKPNSDVRKSGFLSVGVQLYGGGIWHSWFDRDLTVCI